MAALRYIGINKNGLYNTEKLENTPVIGGNSC
jgi:hypothetical protein